MHVIADQDFSREAGNGQDCVNDGLDTTRIGVALVWPLGVAFDDDDVGGADVSCHAAKQLPKLGLKVPKLPKQ